jgi:hypothetical protein
MLMGQVEGEEFGVVWLEVLFSALVVLTSPVNLNPHSLPNPPHQVDQSLSKLNSRQHSCPPSDGGLGLGVTIWGWGCDSWCSAGHEADS